MDGLNDIAVVHKEDNELWILRNHGGFVFSNIGIYPTYDNPHSTEIADLNGDCVPEVITSHVGGPWVYIYENNGAGIMVDTKVLASANGPAHIISADVNMDGVLDLITANTNNGSTTVHISEVDQVGCSVCYGDIDGSGSVDVIDLIEVIGAWGSCPNQCCPSDINNDGDINVIDLIDVISAWGPCI